MSRIIGFLVMLVVGAFAQAPEPSTNITDAYKTYWEMKPPRAAAKQVQNKIIALAHSSKIADRFDAASLNADFCHVIDGQHGSIRPASFTSQKKP